MVIRKTTMADLPAVMEIYARARDYMRETNNPDQWKDNHPPEELIIQDIQANASYCCVDGDKILAVFYFNIEDDSIYAKIQGKWQNDNPYGVVHRIARAPGAKGAAVFCLNWSFGQHPNIRIDTHKDNEPMLKLLDKLGFVYCGIIWIANGEERMAFHKVRDESSVS